MHEFKEVTLPSGAILKMQEAPFSVSKALWQAFLKELKKLSYTTQTDLTVMMKDIMCGSFASNEIEAALWKCMERCLIDGLKLTPNYFEESSARVDFVKVCLEVGKLNIDPFAKGLFAESQQLLAMIGSVQK